MLSVGDKVAVGVSGGADSVCLLHLLSRIKDEYGIMLKVVHVNHNIRGEEAKRDENFVRSLCAELNVELKVFSIDVPALAAECKIGEEECGRKVRYECFNLVGCNKIAVAHTASDNCETVLFNLCRGSSLHGAGGIRPVRDNIIRPLIEMTRQDVEAYCKENNLEYVTDSTNLTDEYTRNKIRLDVVPKLKEINTAFERNLCRFSHIARQEDEYLDKLAQKLLDDILTDKGYSRNLFFEGDSVLRQRAVTILLKKHYGCDYEARQIDLCIKSISESKRLQLSKGLFLECGEYFYFSDGYDASLQPWSVDAHIGETETPAGIYIIEKAAVKDIPYKQRPYAVDFDKLNFSTLKLRSRKTGDTLSDPVRKVSKSIKKLFIEAKIPEYQRNAIPVLESGGELVWVKGFRTDKKYCITDSSEYAVIIKEKRNES